MAGDAEDDGKKWFAVCLLSCAFVSSSAARARCVLLALLLRHGEHRHAMGHARRHTRAARGGH
eukprot:scaffold27966_cov64-Phaeocystis_antarctica.AAC.4